MDSPVNSAENLANLIKQYDDYCHCSLTVQYHSLIAAFLTAAKMDSPVNSAEDLANLIKQYDDYCHLIFDIIIL